MLRTRLKLSERQEGIQYNRRFTITLMIVTVVCVIFFITSMIIHCTTDCFKKQIVIESEGVTVDNMQIERLCLHPGDSVDYKVILKSKVSGGYSVTIDFDEIEDGGLKNFIIISIKDGETLVYNKGLDEALSGDDVVFECDIKANEDYVLDIKYLMPIESGNDAMNTRTSFNIEFTIQRG